MKLLSVEQKMVGIAVMTLCLGIPVMAQAGSFDNDRHRSDRDSRGWSDSRSDYETNRDRHDDRRQYYTDQYGDLDTSQDQRKDQRFRRDGYVSQEGYRSNEERPWAAMSDRSLEKAVRQELSWSPYVDEDPINVSVRQGVVTLQGSVEDRAEMAAAVENAYEAGAKRVDNQLRIIR